MSGEESIDPEAHEVFRDLGVPFSGELTIRAKSGYRTDRRAYQYVYTPQQRDIVAKLYANEIEMFGYEF